MKRRRRDTVGKRIVLAVVCPVPEDLPDGSRWAKLKAIGIALSETVRDGKLCHEVRYYILSKYLPGRGFAEAVRVTTGRY